MEEEGRVSSPVEKYFFSLTRKYQMQLDRVTPFPKQRWAATGVIVVLYVLRSATVGGFYIISYALGIYLLNLLIGFLAPKIDPEVILGETDEEETATDSGDLPAKQEDEFRPFIRKLNEFKFWYVVLLP